MATAKLFKHGGRWAVVLPEDFECEGGEVEIERRNDGTILLRFPRPDLFPELKTLADVAHYLAEKFPDAPDFLDIERPWKYVQPDPD